MFYSRQTNNMLNKLHERARSIVLYDHISDLRHYFRKLMIYLVITGIQKLMIEIYKMKIKLALPVMDSITNRRNVTYSFRNLQEFQLERKRTVFYGIRNINYPAPQLWTLLPEEFNQKNTISFFKSNARQ